MRVKSVGVIKPGGDECDCVGTLGDVRERLGECGWCR